MKKELGQYFTTSKALQETVCKFIMNDPDTILEPSVGRGDLVQCVLQAHPHTTFDMYDVDGDIPFLPCVQERGKSLVIADFLTADISRNYKTIIGNPPYVKHSKGNLYIDFTRRCFHMLAQGGELIFIVPSDFFKLTGSSKLLCEMMDNGTFTHIYHPDHENLFEDASINIIVYRYCKDPRLSNVVCYNGERQYINNVNGLITFSSIEPNDDSVLIGSCFDLYVGMISGKDEVFKHNELGNINVLNAHNKTDKFIYITEFPSGNDKIDAYLTKHRDILMKRKIKRFHDANWFEWGAPRNRKHIEENTGKRCIYVSTLSRRNKVAFVGKVQYFGGTLIMLIPKVQCDLYKITAYFNSELFRKNYLFAGRFKIGHRQLANALLAKSLMTA